MLLREVEYARATTIDEAVRLLAEHENARPLAGGQTLVNVMKARIASPDVLVDINGLEELKRIELGRDGTLELGSMVTYTELVSSVEARARPILGEVAGQIADVQVQNRGTVGGNVCSNDPTNHLPPLLVALDATMTIRGREGERTVPAEDFFLGVYMTAVGAGELLTTITIPPARGAGDGFAAVTVGKEGTCIVSACASVDGDGPRIVLGCVSAVPVRLTEMEARLNGGELSDDAVRAAARGVGASLDPPADVHASSDYRRHLGEVLARRAVLQAAQRARS
ncbi:MAG: xanthine dehydrogenase family protein subunit M [Actinomycetota bacterium]|nr:xanthine dehydrogenase family protein subunit M [Actinomycetota bacterium]